MFTNVLYSKAMCPTQLFYQLDEPIKILPIWYNYFHVIMTNNMYLFCQKTKTQISNKKKKVNQGIVRMYSMKMDINFDIW